MSGVSRDRPLAQVDQLVTGEAVALDLPVASLGLRVLSGLIDLAVELVLLVIGGVVGALVTSDEALRAVAGVLVVVVVLIVGPATLETLTAGRTLGKLALGLRTVRDDAGPISYLHAFVRHLLSMVEVWGLAGVPALLSGLVSASGKRLGDHVAGTYVVRDRFRLQLRPPVRMPPRLAPWAAGADLGTLPDGVALACRQLLGREATLTPQARQRLVTRTLAEALHHVSPPPPADAHPEEVLAAVAAERRRRDQERLRREADLRRRLTGRAGRVD